MEMLQARNRLAPLEISNGNVVLEPPTHDRSPSVVRFSVADDPNNDQWQEVDLNSPTHTNGTLRPPNIESSVTPTNAQRQESNVSVIARRNLPSSRSTVLTIVGFFLSGLMLMLSGIIVLAVEDKKAFVVTGGIFFSLGAIFVSICGYLQQKNINKLRATLQHDLFMLFSVNRKEDVDDDLAVRYEAQPGVGMNRDIS